MKMTGININKYVRIFVKSCPELLEICPLENIKPLVLPPNKFPFISYVHDEIVPDYTKDGQASDDVDVLFACVSDDYEETVQMVSLLRNLLEEKRYDDDEIIIPLIRVKSIAEDYIDNAYVQMIRFNLQIISK